MKLYLAGPISNRPRREWFTEFMSTAHELRMMGNEVVNPAELNFSADGTAFDWATCMRKCISGLMQCDAIYCLPNWRTSKGAQLEVSLAIELGMTLFESFNVELTQAS